MDYLKPTDPNAFLDFPQPVTEAPEGFEICHKCQGHGGWNLRLNAYPNRREDTPENRHYYAHFRAACGVCNGRGYTKDQCDHELKFIENLGRCYDRYECTVCGKKVDIDSSD